ncbi:MAG: tyrosine-type recombinase/integrase [Planctomycetaceae bacterium]|nr:tyrosine-type recombinase/integrase [Planctomycetaceae bacterium]
MCRREKSDFLEAENHEGEKLDFHALRHTCGAWLAMTGAHPKSIQSVMRHSNISLTMDTYGHLFPGQEADTIARFPAMVGGAVPSQLRATGTTDEAQSAVNAQYKRRDSARAGRGPMRPVDTNRTSMQPHNSMQDAELCGDERHDATECESRAAGTRTPNQQIMRQLFPRQASFSSPKPAQQSQLTKTICGLRGNVTSDVTKSKRGVRWNYEKAISTRSNWNLVRLGRRKTGPSVEGQDRSIPNVARDVRDSRAPFRHSCAQGSDCTVPDLVQASSCEWNLPLVQALSGQFGRSLRQRASDATTPIGC